MTPTEQAARWLADVKRHTRLPHATGNWLLEADTLAAIARHLAPGDDLVERATAALEGVTEGPWAYEYTGIGHTVRQPGAYNAIFTVNHAGNYEPDARFIAFARQWVPKAAARISALTAESEMRLQAVQTFSDTADELREDNATLRDRLARVERERDDALTFLDNAVSKSPQPLKDLGAYLASLLDEDDWPEAERYLNAAVKSCAAITESPADGGSNG
jgi:hypothetical protein